MLIAAAYSRALRLAAQKSRDPQNPGKSQPSSAPADKQAARQNQQGSPTHH